MTLRVAFVGAQDTDLKMAKAIICVDDCLKGQDKCHKEN